ncbi:MAG: phage tail tape measure protein [Limnochordia bacterium]
MMKLSVIVGLVDKLSGPVQKMASNFSDLDRLAERGQGLVKAGQQMGLTGALIQGSAQKMQSSLMNLLNPMMEIEERMKPLETVTTSTMGSMQASLDATLAAAREWAREHRQSVDDYLNAATGLASAGLNDVQAIEGARAALSLATAAMGDNRQAAELLATLYNNMGDKTRDVAEEMTRLGDAVAITMQLNQIKDLAQLGEGMKYATSAALLYQDSLESALVAVGALNTAGLAGGQAGTAYAAALRTMTRASRMLGFEVARTADGGLDLVGTLQNIRDLYGDSSQWSEDVAMAFQQAFGDEGIRAIGLLLGRTELLREQLDEVRNTSGAMAYAQQAIESSLPARLDILRNNLNDVRITLVEGLVPGLHRAAELARGVVQWFGNFAKAHPNLVRTVVLIFALATGVLSILAPIFVVASGFTMMVGHGMTAVARLGRAFMTLRGWIQSSQIAAYAARIGVALRQMALTGWQAVIQAGRATVQYAGLLARMAASGGAAAARMVVSMAMMARQALVTAVSALPALISSVWAFTAALLANPITWIIVAIVALGAAIYLLVRHWGSVFEAVRSAWAGIRRAVANGVSQVMQFVGRIGRFLARIAFPPLSLSFLWNRAREGIEEAGGFLPWAYQQIQAVLSLPLRLLGIDPEAFFASIEGAIQWVYGKFEEWRQAGAALWDAFTEGIRSLVSSPVEAVKEGLAWLRNLLPFSDAKEGPMSDLTTSGQQLILTLAEGMRGAMPALHRTLATGLAGLALTALPVVSPVVAARAEDMGPDSYPPIIQAMQAPTIAGEAVYDPVFRNVEVPAVAGTLLYEPSMTPFAAPSTEGAAVYTATPPAPFALPELLGTAAYDVLPVAPPSVDIPVLFDVAQLALPAVPELSGRAVYDALPAAPPSVDIPVLFDVAQLALPAVPELSGRAVYDALFPDEGGNIPPAMREAALTVEPLSLVRERSSDGRGGGSGSQGRTFIVQGDLVVNIDYVKDAEDLVDGLWDLAEEGGFS